MSASTASLSREIVFGTLDGVKALIKAGANVNEKDSYGFTPLIEATLKENIEIARLLLDNGAKIDQQDISGQTALQWAVNKGYVDFCDLYLQFNANTNHYSADGQPILVNPILREQNELIELLISKGAQLEFAYDFINAKLIGHRYELSGRGKIINTRGRFIDINYEGFYLEFTVGLVLKTLVAFINSDANKAFSAYKTVLSKLSRALKSAAELIPYKYVPKGALKQDALIRRALNEELVVVPVSYEGHAITFIKYKNLFAKCDRGVKQIVDTVVIYQVGNIYALTPDFLKDLMYRHKSSEYINTEINKILGLKPLATLPARYQLSGNCSWANVEASVPAMMFMLMFKGASVSLSEVALLKKSIMSYYDAWVEWDKNRVLEDSLRAFSQANKARKAAIASVLAAILFQRCRASYKNEIERAKKILTILMLPEYRYIIKTYLKVYHTKMGGSIGAAFVNLLAVCGMPISTL